MTIAVISMIRDAWGGSEELWYEMAKEARKDEITVVHAGYETPYKHEKLIELEGLGVKQIDRPGWVPATTSPLKQKLYIGKNFLRKKINSPISKIFKFNPDIILYVGTSYSIAKETELLERVRKSTAKFFILSELNLENIRSISSEEASTVSKAYDLCKKVFFVSQRNLDVAQRHLCRTIYNGLVVRNPVNLKKLECLPYPELKTVVQLAMVGNLVTVHKGQDNMLEALSKMKMDNWELNIFGKGHDKEYLQELARFLKIDHKITFHGTVKDIRDIWASNHVLLMPSHIEGMPLALVEAMVCGRVCIGTDVGGISEWLIDGENGFLAEAPTVTSLLKTLEIAFSKIESWPAIAAAAHTTAIKLLDPNAGLTLLNLMKAS